MKSEHWTDRLSEHLDGDLNAAEKVACEAHLSECAECASVLEELRAVVAQASLLPELPPARNLWPEIESRLSPRAVSADTGVVPLSDRRRRVTLTVPQLAAAAIALILLSAGGAWLVLPGVGGPSAAPGGAVAAAGAAAGGGAPQTVFAASYQQAISQLEMEFERRRADLDPETIRVVEENLAIIDAAIADAGQALTDDPASAFLNTHLANAMRQKVDLLRQVATIERLES